MYDVIVIGTGGIGSAALYELARRGVKVLGLDRFPPGHDRGSSHGQTRIIRRSYFEHSNYVPLLNIAYELWDDLCEVSGNDLFQRTGLVYVGAKDNPVIEGVVRSSQDHQVKLESLSAADVAQRFPGYSAPEGATVLLEPDAGYLRVESAVRTCIDEAQKLGAESLHDIEVVGWKPNGTGVIVETTTGRFEAKKLVVTAGCWANSFLLDLNITLQVVRKHLHWYATNDDRYEQSSGCPCFFYGVSNGYFYGFPETANQGLKVAEHSGGTDIDDPLTDDRNPDQTDTARVEQFLSSHLPGVSNRRLDHEVCFYTMTPDAHFIIDRHPSYPQVTFAAGMSGHGFKFAPAIGRLLTELTLDGRPSADVEFLGLGRPGLLS
jgi:sarcosine oxidase